MEDWFGYGLGGEEPTVEDLSLRRKRLDRGRGWFISTPTSENFLRVCTLLTPLRRCMIPAPEAIASEEEMEPLVPVPEAVAPQEEMEPSIPVPESVAPEAEVLVYENNMVLAAKSKTPS